jgi:hypothetical protein
MGAGLLFSSSILICFLGFSTWSLVPDTSHLPCDRWLEQHIKAIITSEEVSFTAYFPCLIIQLVKRFQFVFSHHIE